MSRQRELSVRIIVLGIVRLAQEGGLSRKLPPCGGGVIFMLAAVELMLRACAEGLRTARSIPDWCEMA